MPFEEWDDTPKINKKRLFLIVLAISLLIGTGATMYKIFMSPPSDEVEQNVPATLSKPSVNATSAVNGDTIQITTQLSDGLDGVQIFFYENGTQIGSAYTDSTGTAIFNRVLPDVTEQTWRVYTADGIHP